MARQPAKQKSASGDTSDGMQALITEHLMWMRATNYAERTVKSRKRLLMIFTRWCEERGIHRAQAVSKAVLESFRRYVFHQRRRDGKPLTSCTQFKWLCDVRQWFRWLSRQNYVLYNPAADMDLPKREKKLPKHVLTAAEVDEVMNQVDINTWQGVRDRAILEMFYSTGMRCSEVQRLKLEDLSLANNTVYVRQGKGKKDRVVPIGERAVRWLQRYLNEVRSELACLHDQGVVFLRDIGVPLSCCGLTRLVSKYVDAAGIGKKGGCHLFRHSMATLMLENGADIRFIQQMLGHESLRSTQIYTQVSIRKLKEVHRQTHPGALLKRVSSPVPPSIVGK